MRTWCIAILGLTLVWAVAAGGHLHAPSGSSPEEALVVGSELDYPPLALVRSDGSADGFTVDLIKAIADTMNLDITFRVGPWNEVLDACRRGEVHILPNVARTPEREAYFDFTVPHAVLTAAIFIREGDGSIHGPGDLDGRRIIVMEGDTGHEYVHRHVSGGTLVLTRSLADAMRLLRDGAGDCVVVGRVMGLQTLAAEKITGIEPLDRPLPGGDQQFCIAVPKGNEHLLAHLNEGLAILKADGRYDAIYERWLGVYDPPTMSVADVMSVVAASVGVCALVLLGATIRLRVLNRRIHAQQDQLVAAKQSAEAANASKSQFLANMSHEIRTPLTAIMGFADLLQESDLPTDRRMQYAGIIHSNGQHLLGVINDVLDLSKIEAGRVRLTLEPVPVAEVITEVLRTMQNRAQSKGLRLEARWVTPAPETLGGDILRLRQILMNLLGNAIKFTPTGSVTVEVGCAQEREEMWITVADTGIGIAPEQLPHLFEPFHQGDASTSRRYGGTGLGLAISRRFAVMLGGDLTLRSTQGAGTRATLTLPTGPIVPDSLIQPDAQTLLAAVPTKTADALPVPNLRNRRILLAEDGRDNQMLVRLYLKPTGVSLDVVGNGREALEAVLSSGAGYDLVLMDIQMPVMDGYTSTSMMRDAGARMPILALTAHALPTEHARCLASGCNEVLCKPIDRAALLAAVGRHLAATAAAA